MDAVAEVKSRLNIEDVIGQYVQLKRAGRNFKGLSPFSNEKSPSFIVSPEKQIWHDFSSGRGGDMFTFVQEVEGLDFRGALEMLARNAGVDLEQFSSAKSGPNRQLKDRTLEVLELATKFYQKQLTVNQPALNYLLKDRNLTKQTLLAWRLGYSPNTGRALSDFLTKHGFDSHEMKRAGLIYERRNGVGDMFRGRIMIPLCDARGSVIGFTARLLMPDDNAPKYINTPQTITYDKSRNVFGLHMAKESIRKTGVAVVVEGNMDVIASNQAGVANVVASAGTAMTEMHLRELKRFSGDIRLCFDADPAGVAATERAIPLAQKTEVNLRIITITGAKDPDELVQKDIAAWRAAIDAAVDAPQWLIKHYQADLDLDTAPGKRAFTDVLLPTIRRLRDPVEQEHYFKKIAELTDSSLEAVLEKSGKTAAVQVLQKKVKIDPSPIDRIKIEYQKLQDHLLAMTLMQPKTRDLLTDCQSQFFNEGTRRNLLEFLQKNPDFKGDNSDLQMLYKNFGMGASDDTQRETTDYVKILGLQFEELYSELPLTDLQEQAAGLKRRLIDRYVKIQKHQIALSMQDTADEAKTRKLIDQANKLNQLISTHSAGK